MIVTKDDSRREDEERIINRADKESSEKSIYFRSPEKLAQGTREMISSLHHEQLDAEANSQAMHHAHNNAFITPEKENSSIKSSEKNRSYEVPVLKIDLSESQQKKDRIWNSTYLNSDSLFTLRSPPSNSLSRPEPPKNSKIPPVKETMQLTIGNISDTPKQTPGRYGGGVLRTNSTVKFSQSQTAPTNIDSLQITASVPRFAFDKKGKLHANN